MAPVSKSLYIDKSGGIVRWIQLDEYKHTYQSINKPADLKSSTYIDLGKENNEKKLNLMEVTKQEYQNIKIFLQKVTFQNGLKKFLRLQMLKVLYHGHMLLVILTVKRLLEDFSNRNCKKQIKEN